MRAQRAFNDFGIARAERPLIAKTNVVIAEPMPGEQDLLEEFLRELREDRLEGLIREALAIPPEKTVRATKAMADSLADLVRAVWNGMELAGELGSLLKIELRLQDAIAEGQKEWEERLPLFRVVEYGLGGETKEKYVRFVEGRDNDFWSKAEQLTLHALRRYAAKQSANGKATARRLFAEDAEHGFALVDLCRKRFDVVLMKSAFRRAEFRLEEHHRLWLTHGRGANSTRPSSNAALSLCILAEGSAPSHRAQGSSCPRSRSGAMTSCSRRRIRRLWPISAMAFSTTRWWRLRRMSWRLPEWRSSFAFSPRETKALLWRQQYAPSGMAVKNPASLTLGSIPLTKFPEHRSPIG